MDEMEMKIWEAIRAHPSGVKNDSLPSVCGVDASVMKEALNALLANHYVVIQQMAGGNDIVFVAVEKDEAELLSSLDDQERMVYSHIKVADNRGIWLRDLTRLTALHKGVISKVIKSMEQRNIIKWVKSVKNPSKKMLMLYNLVPSVDITGGAWFTDNELDSELITKLSMVALRFIAEKCKPRTKNALLSMNFKYPSANDVLQFITEKNILMQEIALSDIEDLLNMLVDARQLERVDLQGYRPDPRSAQDEMYKMNWLTEMPCGRCPVFEKCSSIGAITPETCDYFTQWLSF